MKEKMFFDFWKIGLWGAIILISIVVFRLFKRIRRLPRHRKYGAERFFPVEQLHGIRPCLRF